MTLSWEGLSQKVITRVFRIFGKSKFIHKLQDFLLHGGRISRSKTMINSVKVLRTLEEVKGIRIQRLAAIVEMMRTAGFSDKDIQEAVQKEGELLDVSDALDTVLQYVERGEITITSTYEAKRIPNPDIHDEDSSMH